MKPKLISGPHAEPVTLAEAKAHCRVDDSNSDTLISALIQAARESAELFCERAFVQRTHQLQFDCFPGRRETPMLLIYPPVVAVTQVKYIDVDGTLKTWSSGEYHVDTHSEPGRIMPNRDQSYPSDVDRDRLGAVRVDYVSGYPADESGSPTDFTTKVPRPIKQAILMMVAEWFKNRENTVVGVPVVPIPDAAKSLLWQYKVFR